jgi:DNA modification methylase
MELVTGTQNEAGKQLPLFDAEEAWLPQPASIASSPNEKGAAFNDPAFAANKVLPIHRWVPWIAGFSKDFVKQMLDTYQKEKGTILDPFAGVGTTLVESMMSGHNSIGFEINPYAALACRTKIQARNIDVAILKREILRLKTFCEEKRSSDYVPRSTPPVGFKTRAAFYSPAVLHKILIFQDFLGTIEHIHLQELFQLAFAATMVRYSNYSYEPSLTRRVSSGKTEILDFPVIETILAKVAEMKEDIAWLQSRPPQQTQSSIINDTFFNYRSHLDPDSIDLIVTSPPYLNNYHYNRNTRPQLYWLDYMKKPDDLKPLENANFGKYWQTVRDQKQIDLDFTLPGTDIEERLKLLRTLNPEKKTYGGNGWANYAASYFNDCYKLATGIRYCLKPGGSALVVLGNSILQGITIPTDQYFAKIAQSIGLELVEIHVPRATRVGSSIIQSSVRVGKAKDSHQLYEAVIELRKQL